MSRVAFIMDEMFEDSEFRVPYDRVKEAGHEPVIVGLEKGKKIAGSDKPVAAICHAGWMLAEADIARGKTVTSWPSIRTDLVNAGANWVNQEVAEDGNLITSRKPDDLEAFTKTLLTQIEQQS